MFFEKPSQIDEALKISLGELSQTEEDSLLFFLSKAQKFNTWLHLNFDIFAR